MSSLRTLFVATEPNGGNPNSGVLDMGDWFRTANQSNNYHSNKRFHSQYRMILDGILRTESGSNFSHFRFMDLKATGGGAKSKESDIVNYIESKALEIAQYFFSRNENFGLRPHAIVLLGNSAYDLFSAQVFDTLRKYNPGLKWVQMRHPSARTVANDLLRSACTGINVHLTSIDQRVHKWFCKRRLQYGWTTA